MKEVILNKAKKFERQTKECIELLESRNISNDDREEKGLFKFYQGKMSAIIEVLRDLDMEEEAKTYEWVFTYEFIKK
jgi:hypothetical protein